MNNHNFFSGKETIQEFFFKKSLMEVGEKFDKSDIKIDHMNGKNFYKGKEFNLIFPKYLIDHVYKLSKNKTIDYCFIGKLDKTRSWVSDYSNRGVIKNSLYGRNFSLKYNIDSEYYSIVSSSKFTLCPIGSCPWSYRFFESIMCHSIPVVDTSTKDVFRDKFKFLSKDESHSYINDYVSFNYEILIKDFTLN